MAETVEPMSSDFRGKRLGIIFFLALLLPLVSTNIGEREFSPQSIPSLSHDDVGWTGGAEKAIIDFDIDSLMKLQGVFIQFVDFAGMNIIIDSTHPAMAFPKLTLRYCQLIRLIMSAK